jgi:uncharacterized Fe-S cluster-containing radical SAM superfamily protein
MSGFDPIQRSEEVARLVCEGDRRRYRRFRPARFFGGIATADCVGCNLRCLFCWSWPEVVPTPKPSESSVLPWTWLVGSPPSPGRRAFAR